MSKLSQFKGTQKEVDVEDVLKKLICSIFYREIFSKISRCLYFQYQYLLDPHALTVQSVYQHQITSPSVQDGGSSMGSNLLRLKASYTYMAKYGGSFSHFNQSGNFATATTGNTGEVFFIPLQNIRLGLQYTQYSRVANIDNPHDANTLRLYGWFAY